MDISTFRRIVTAFADEPVDVDISKGIMVAQIRDEILELSLVEQEGTIWVRDGDDQQSAYNWIIRRLARLHLLADRILTKIPEEKFFVDPEGMLLDDLETVPNSQESTISNAVHGVSDALRETVAGVTRVLYLTSDAGEGKTTLINHVARLLAEKFKRREISWLLVPVSLAGRPFMALDDIVVAELTNRFRFNLYYDAFTEIVKLNAVVPALDGFEEVFLETGSGEAVSALGNLINQLNGSGRVLIAARKAYFEVRSFASQARIFDTIGQNAGASFERLSLQRWSRDKFLEYSQTRDLKEPEEIHKQISIQLQDEYHPLLSRAVLVSRLIDVALEGDMESLFERLSKDPEDYFFQFVGKLIEREALTKWIDRSRLGDAASPLLSVDEHFSLLTQIAREMWINKTDALGLDYIELIADVFNSEYVELASTAHQVKERLHQHSLLVTRGSKPRKLAFDHEDFRLFFLGHALGTELIKADPMSMGTFLRTASLPTRTVDAAISYVVREQGDIESILRLVQSIGISALETSYEKENAGLVMIRLLELPRRIAYRVESLSFPINSLRMRVLKGVEFLNCRFRTTEIGPTSDWHVTFVDCYFDTIDLRTDSRLEGVKFENCEIASIFFSDRDEAFFSPDEISDVIRSATVTEATSQSGVAEVLTRVDKKTRIAEHALRAFLRATHLNENVFRQRMGQDANDFFATVLPVLLGSGVLEEIEYRGAGTQRRFKLTAPMRNIEPAIRHAKDLVSFTRILKSGA